MVPDPPQAQPWFRSHRFDGRAVALADRHYNRQKPGSPQFVPPGRNRVYLTEQADACWVSLWQEPQWVKHDWPHAWVNSLFRNEGGELSSGLIVAAVAATRHDFGAAPAQGFVTFVDAGKVRRKRDPGRCYRRAGWVPVGETQGGLLVLQQLEADMPEPLAPSSLQGCFDFGLVA